MVKIDVKKLGLLSNQRFIYGLIVAFFIIYLFANHWIFAALCGVSLVWAVAIEFLQGTQEHGILQEALESASALIVALIVWFAAGFLLQTSSPLNAIVSCSMLPHVQRGDLVILQGGALKAPLADVASVSELGDADVYEKGKHVATVKGSFYAYCAQRHSSGIDECARFSQYPENFVEEHGEFSFGYDSCEMVFPKTGETAKGPCVSYVEVNGERYYENLSNDVAVYAPEKDEYYSLAGDIIHRVFLKVRTEGGQIYFLTKGDNNPVFDVQVHDSSSKMGNRPIEIERSKGKILFSVPYVGFFKLFISPGAIMTPEGCDRQYAKYGSK